MHTQYMRLLGYPASSISVLTTYNGQKALLKDVFERRCAAHPAFGRPSKVCVGSAVVCAVCVQCVCSGVCSGVCSVCHVYVLPFATHPLSTPTHRHNPPLHTDYHSGQVSGAAK